MGYQNLTDLLTGLLDPPVPPPLDHMTEGRASIRHIGPSRAVASEIDNINATKNETLNKNSFVFVHGAWSFVDELTRSTSADNDGDDNMLKNLAAIFRVLIF